jgi:hypothetical protein
MIEQLSTGAIMILATQGCTLLAAVIGVFMSLRNGSKINAVEVRFDGRMDQLLKLTAESSHAAGKIEGVAQEKATPS